MNDGQAPNVVKQYQNFGFLGWERNEDNTLRYRWNKQGPIYNKENNYSIHIVILSNVLVKLFH